MDRYLYLDQVACLKFRLFHMLLEISKCRKTNQCLLFFVKCAFRDFPQILQERISVAPCWFHIFLQLSFKHRVTLSRKLTSFLFPWHMFCFSCKQFCPTSVRCWLSVLRLRWVCPFCLLSSSKDQEEQRIAVSGAVGGVHRSRSFKVCCHWRIAFPCWYPSAGSPWKSGELLVEGSQAGLQEVSLRLRERCVVNFCSEACDRPGVELFLPSYFGWWNRLCPYATLWHVAWWTPPETLGEGRGDGGLHVRIPVVCARANAAGANFNKEPPWRRERADSLLFTVGFGARRHMF